MHVSSIFVNFFGYILVAFCGRFFLIRVASSAFTSSVSLRLTPSPQGEGRGLNHFTSSVGRADTFPSRGRQGCIFSLKGKAGTELFHLIRRLRRHLPLKGKARLELFHLIRRLRRHLPRKGKARGGSLHIYKFRAIITPSAIDKRQAVSPLYIQGRILPPDSLERGGCPMSTSEVFELCMVIIGICSLFIQIYKKK